MTTALATALAALLAAAPAAGSSKPAKPAKAIVPQLTTIVACAPGYPGTTAEAQPGMNAFAAAVSKAVGLPPTSVKALYVPSEKAGLARMQQPDVGVALVTLPFYVAHAAELRLQPQLTVENEGRGPSESWTLVARKGALKDAAGLAGFRIESIAGYAPGFVRAALAGWGAVPKEVPIAPTRKVLTSLRQAAGGEKVAVLLDAGQAASLASLPFAGELEVVAKSEPLPAALVCVLTPRMKPSKFRPLSGAMLRVAGDPEGAAALKGIRMVRFAPLDAAVHASLSKVMEASR